MSLFLIDTEPEQIGVRPFSYYLAKELKLLDIPFRYYIPENSALPSEVRFDEFPVEPLRQRFEKGVFNTWRMARAMKRAGCRLVHSLDPASLPMASAAAIRAKVPLQVVTWSRSAAVDTSAVSLQKCLRAVDLVVVREEEAGEELLELGISSEAIKFLPLGRDFSAYTRPEDRDFLRREFKLGPDVRLVGVKTRFAGGKTWLILKRLKQILASDSSATRVVILGEGNLDVGNRETVIPEGFLYYLGRDETFSRLVASLDLFVILSSEAEDLERLQAAMAAGVPLVTATKNGVPRELVHQKTGLRFPPDDTSALVRSLSEVLRNHELRARLAKDGQEALLGKHSVQAMARSLIKEYQRIARRKGVSLIEAAEPADTT